MKACLWRSEGSLQEMALSFCHVNSGDLTQVITFDGKHLYSLSHLACPVFLVISLISSTRLMMIVTENITCQLTLIGS